MPSTGVEFVPVMFWPPRAQPGSCAPAVVHASHVDVDAVAEVAVAWQREVERRAVAPAIGVPFRSHW